MSGRLAKLYARARRALAAGAAVLFEKQASPPPGDLDGARRVRCDACGCTTPPVYECGCTRCNREPLSERFHACPMHRDTAEAEHVRLRGPQHRVKWYLGPFGVDWSPM